MNQVDLEIHLGGGAVMRKKPPARNNIAIDAEPLASFDCDYHVQKINDCAHRYLREYDYVGTELIYCDPPYLIETRTSKRRYRYECSRQNHLDLIDQLKTLPCRVILSGYPSALYREHAWFRPHAIELRFNLLENPDRF